MSADVAAIVSGLTKAQKGVILRWSGSHGEVTDPALDPFWFCIMKDGPDRFRLSPTKLGLSVRSSLQQGEGRDGG